MSTPLGSSVGVKRHLLSGGEPTRKAPRLSKADLPRLEAFSCSKVGRLVSDCSDVRSSSGCSNDGIGSSSLSGDPNISALLSTLQSTVRALKAMDPSGFGESQQESLLTAEKDLCQVCDCVEEQLEAKRNPPPDEVPIAFDHLVLALSFLPAADLAQAAATSRHFARAIPDAVRMRLDTLAGGYFETRYRDKYNTELLRRVEEDHSRMPGIVARISPTTPEKVYEGLRDQLEDMHSEVLYLHVDLLWMKLEELSGIERMHSRRGDLVRWISTGRPPAEELGAHADQLVAEFSPDAAGGVNFRALMLMEDLPPEVVQDHLGVLVWWLKEEHSALHGSSRTHTHYASSALAAVRKVTCRKALEQYDVAEAVRPLTTSSDRQLRESAKEFLKGLAEPPALRA